jgi:myo-inositol-1(or 4)-monophosphatase
MTLEVSLKEIRIALLDAAAVASRNFGRASTTVATKQNATPVTSVDREISTLLHERLTRLLPEAAWRGEEDQEGDAACSADLVWIVDPLDGTKEFIRGIPEFGVSVALVAEGKPVAGGIVNPITGELGVWSSGNRLTVTHRHLRNIAQSLDAAVANVSRTEYEKGSLRGFSRGLNEMRPLGSVAYKLLRLASGHEDLYFSVEPKSEWDICAGAALVWAAGLEYRRFDGEPISFGGENSRIRSGAVAGPARLVDDFIRRFESEIARSQALIASGAVR